MSYSINLKKASPNMFSWFVFHYSLSIIVFPLFCCSFTGRMTFETEFLQSMVVIHLSYFLLQPLEIPKNTLW